MSSGTRRTGRSYALQLLYARDGDASNNLSSAAVNWASDFDLEVDEAAQGFARALVASAVERSQEIAGKITANLGGRGIFGVELFIRGDDVIFSEVSPRPHDTGLVTLISQDLPQFALHARAILGLPVPNVRQRGPAASCAMAFDGHVTAPRFEGVAEALAEPDTMLRLFGKPAIEGHRRMGVALALGGSIDEARAKARRAAVCVKLVP